MLKDLGVKPYVFPMPVLMISTYNEDGSVDVMNMAWGGVCAENMVALNIDEDHKTAANIKRTGAFALSVADVDHIEAAEEIRQYVSADENGEPQSYLVAASVTKRLLNTANLVVPVSVMRDGVILPNHLTEILDAFTALHGNDNLSEWLVAEDLTVPAADRRAAIVKSTIMRASLTAQLAFHTERFTVAQSNVELSQDVYGRAVVIIDEQEMSALFTALDVLGVTGELKVPYYSSTDFREAGKYYYQLDTLYESSVMRYRFSDIWGTSGGEGAYESAFVLEKQSGGVVSNDVNKFVISLEKQKELLESYRPRN